MGEWEKRNKNIRDVKETIPTFLGLFRASNKRLLKQSTRSIVVLVFIFQRRPYCISYAQIVRKWESSFRNKWCSWASGSYWRIPAWTQGKTVRLNTTHLEYSSNEMAFQQSNQSMMGELLYMYISQCGISRCTTRNSEHLPNPSQDQRISREHLLIPPTIFRTHPKVLEDFRRLLKITRARRRLSPLIRTKFAFSSFWKLSVGLFALFRGVHSARFGGKQLEKMTDATSSGGKKKLKGLTGRYTLWREATKCYNRERRLKILEWKHSCDRCAIL